MSAVSGLANDALSGIASVSCNGTPASLASGSFSCSLVIVQASFFDQCIGYRQCGNTSSSAITVNLQGPKLTITSPAPLSLFTNNSTTVTGTVDDPLAVATVNGVRATVSGATFSADGVTLREGNNLVTATGINAGGAAGTASVNLILDTTPPTVRIDLRVTTQS